MLIWFLLFLSDNDGPGDPGPGPTPDVGAATSTRIAALYSASRIPFRPRR